MDLCRKNSDRNDDKEAAQVPLMANRDATTVLNFILVDKVFT